VLDRLIDNIWTGRVTDRPAILFSNNLIVPLTF